MALFSQHRSFNYCLTAALLVLLLLSCAEAPHFIASPPTSSGKQTIILVPGFKSSLLGTKSGKTVWITASEVLFGSISLALPNAELGIENVELFDQGLLKKVRVLPGIYSYDLYDSFVARLNSDMLQRSKIVEFHYDWRKDNFLAVKALRDLIDKEKSEGAAVTLIGHSMGGMIVSYYLRYGAQDFGTGKETWEGLGQVDKVVLAGTPFAGALQIFHDMQSGNTTGLNSSLLSAEALSSFPASYQLLPLAQTSIADAATWEKQSWGLFQEKESLPANVLLAREKFVNTNLIRAQHFHTKLNAPSFQVFQRRRPALLNLTGAGRNTLSKLNSNGTTNELDYRDATLADGDGIVPAESAQLPGVYREAFSVTDFESTAKHEGLLSDCESYQVLKDFLRR